MTADAPIRFAFYLVEAGALALVFGCGLVLAQSAARRAGRSFPAVTRGRMAALWAGLVAFDAASGELVGPQVIVQYHAAGLALVVSAALWAFSLVLAARRGTPPGQA
jgi:hypothetical protein